LLPQVKILRTYANHPNKPFVDVGAYVKFGDQSNVVVEG
jgi:hypothetical protein